MSETTSSQYICHFCNIRLLTLSQYKTFEATFKLKYKLCPSFQWICNILWRGDNCPCQPWEWGQCHQWYWEGGLSENATNKHIYTYCATLLNKVLLFSTLSPFLFRASGKSHRQAGLASFSRKLMGWDLGRFLGGFQIWCIPKNYIGPSFTLLHEVFSNRFNSSDVFWKALLHSHCSVLIGLLCSSIKSAQNRAILPAVQTRDEICIYMGGYHLEALG